MADEAERQREEHLPGAELVALPPLRAQEAYEFVHGPKFSGDRRGLESGTLGLTAPHGQEATTLTIARIPLQPQWSEASPPVPEPVRASARTPV